MSTFCIHGNILYHLFSIPNNHILLFTTDFTLTEIVVNRKALENCCSGYHQIPSVYNNTILFQVKSMLNAFKSIDTFNYPPFLWDPT